MSTIPRKSVHRAIDQVTTQLSKLAKTGPLTPGAVARTNLSEPQKAFATALVKLAARRNETTVSDLSPAELRATATYAKKTLLDARDTDANGFSAREVASLSKTAKLAVALVGGPPPAAPAEPTELDVSDMTPAAALARVEKRLPKADLKAIIADTIEAMEQRDGTPIGTTRVSSVERQPNGTEHVTTTGTFDYEGTEFSFYAVFEVDKAGGHTLVDSGAD
ncbi:MAG: hypothetical protein SFW67_17685 [Myxococcaceae bacterium]|nr:hypothetical protein [Myxococcaceae bacterium]